MEWHTLAENLPVGHKTRSDCDCGGGKTLIINNATKGYSCHCFRCDRNEFVSKGTQSLEELARIRKLNEEAKTTELALELPHDYTKEIPLHGRLWLYSNGITETVWSSYNIGYSKYLDRVILPIREKTGNLVWFQCRALNRGQEPKYLQPSGNRDTILFHAGECKGNSERIIAVEDILSAIRVGKHVQSVSILGTKITTAQANQLSNHAVTTWLDNDAAGRRGAYNIRKTLSLVTNVTNIVTPVDPKKLTDKQIRTALSLN